MLPSGEWRRGGDSSAGTKLKPLAYGTSTVWPFVAETPQLRTARKPASGSRRLVASDAGSAGDPLSRSWRPDGLSPQHGLPMATH